jgi:hypothetical protein
MKPCSRTVQQLPEQVDIYTRHSPTAARFAVPNTGRKLLLSGPNREVQVRRLQTAAATHKRRYTQGASWTPTELMKSIVELSTSALACQSGDS